MANERVIELYIDTKTGDFYYTVDGTAQRWGANIPAIGADELVFAMVQLCDGEPVFVDGELQNPDTRFADTLAAGEIVIDNNNNWYDKATLSTAITSGVSISSIYAQLESSEIIPRIIGTIKLDDDTVINYNGWSKTDNIFKFELADSEWNIADFTPTSDYAQDFDFKVFEYPVILSSQNDDSGRNTGLFTAILDAANPVYEEMIEGNSSIANCQLEFNVYVSSRCVFRAHINFDCNSALSGGNIGNAWVRPSMWTLADSRYIKITDWQAPNEYQFSVDGSTDWHDSQNIGVDRFYREKRPGGEYGNAIALFEGEKGDPFSFGAVGLLADRVTYDDEAVNFTYLATDTGDVYYKLSATSADWSSAIPFAAADSLALKTDITAHNESETAHNDIRVELGNKANASDVTTALGNKVDKDGDKQLSDNNFSDEDKSKVDALGSMSAEDATDYRTAADQDLIDVGKVNSNAAITGATKTKITYDSKGLVTAGADLEESDIPNISTSKITGLGTMSAENAADYRTASEQDLIDAVAYGVIYDPSSSSPVCQKVIMTKGTIIPVLSFGNLTAHNFKRCVMDDLAARHVNYYLNQYDSTKKADGTAADLTGADGDVMVEIPITYWKYQTMKDGKILYLVSDKTFSGASIHPFFYVSPDGKTARTQYVGAFQSTICDASGERIANMMNQGATESSSYASGYKARSVAGCKPWTSMSQSTHRTAAANNGAQGVNSLFHQYLFLMMLIEGGSFNTQDAISPGFAYASTWNYAFTRLSGRANFGNGTGSILADATQDSAITWQSVADALKVVQFSYRGIENPYGEIWKFEDGIQKYQNVVDDELTDGCYWWTAATSLYTDVDQQAAETPTYARVAHAWPATGYVKTWRPDNFLPLTVGGASTTYLCDYFYNDSAAGARVVSRGNRMLAGAAVGGGSVAANTGLANANTIIGGRLAA